MAATMPQGLSGRKIGTKAESFQHHPRFTKNPISDPLPVCGPGYFYTSHSNWLAPKIETITKKHQLLGEAAHEFSAGAVGPFACRLIVSRVLAPTSLQKAKQLQKYPILIRPHDNTGLKFYGTNFVTSHNPGFLLFY